MPGVHVSRAGFGPAFPGEGGIRGRTMFSSLLPAWQGQQSRNGSMSCAGRTGLPLPRLVALSLAAELKFSVPSIFP